MAWHDKLVSDKSILHFINAQRNFVKNSNKIDVYDTLLKRQYLQGVLFNKKPNKVMNHNLEGYTLYDCARVIGPVAVYHTIREAIDFNPSISLLVLKNLHNPIDMAFHLGFLTEREYLCLMLQATTPVMSYGTVYKKLVGNNLIGIATPYHSGPILVDCSLGETAVRNIMYSIDTEEIYYDKNHVVDVNGIPFTSPKAALATGTIKSIGRHKGGAIALGIQLLLAAMSGTVLRNNAQTLDIDGENSLFLLLIKSSPALNRILTAQLEDIFKENVYVPGRRNQ
ncbi:Ldh family oxidoreductase [Martelella alba]|nr:Ldh family oxidoreductase [Martelella alba]